MKQSNYIRLPHRAQAYVHCLHEVLAETVWPTRCIVCDKPGYLICPDCEAGLNFIDYWQSCPRCGAKYGRYQCCECGTGTSSTMEIKELSFDDCRSVAIFDAVSARIVTVWKDAGEQRLVDFMGAYMAQNIPPYWLGFQPCITYVPATQKAIQKRGFDHGKDLAYACARFLNLPVVCAFRQPQSIDQRKLNKHERRENMQGRLVTKKQSYTYQSYIVVDDVFTSGATLINACNTLKQQGATHTFALTFARV